MPEPAHLPFPNLDEDRALRIILEGTAMETAERFFEVLVKNLAHGLHTTAVWVTKYISDTRRLKALAFYLDGTFLNDWEMDITGTPREQVIDQARFIHYPGQPVESFSS